MSTLARPVLATSLAASLVMACASFGTRAEPMADLPEGGVPTGSDAGDANVPADPCAGGDPAVTVASLYVAGGRASDGSEPLSILRAPVRCDGQLGEWASVQTLLRSAQVPIAAVLGDTFLALGGQHTAGGASFIDAFDSAHFDGKGGIGELARRAGTPAQTGVWRAQFASNGETLFVAGGEGPNASNVPIATVTTWTLSGKVPVPTAAPSLPVPSSRGGGAMIGNTMFVLAPGHSADPDAGLTAEKGAIYTRQNATGAPWTRAASFDDFDFDFGIAASASAIYTVSGAFDPAGVRVFFYENGALQPPVKLAQSLPKPMYGAGVTIVRDHLYVVGGGDGALVVSAKLTPTGIAAEGFQTTTPLPAARSFGVAFAR